MCVIKLYITVDANVPFLHSLFFYSNKKCNFSSLTFFFFFFFSIFALDLFFQAVWWIGKLAGYEQQNFLKIGVANTPETA